MYKVYVWLRGQGYVFKESVGTVSEAKKLKSRLIVGLKEIMPEDWQNEDRVVVGFEEVYATMYDCLLLGAAHP